MDPLKVAQNSPLGKQTTYVASYQPDLLFPIPRNRAREAIGIKNNLPFTGADIWTGYELSWLNPKGKPQIAIADFRFPYDSECLIESKSFKLYLNSFNQSTFSSYEDVQKVMQKDLSVAAQTAVEVHLFSPSEFDSLEMTQLKGICLDELDVCLDDYEINESFLTCSSIHVQETLYSNLLKSNCLVTGQPDWASVLISYSGPQINQEGLLKYLISFRNHQGFHEQCVEKIFCDIMHYCHPEKLTIYARYTRRGGLDINPFRSNFEQAPHNNNRLARQ